MRRIVFVIASLLFFQSTYGQISVESLLDSLDRMLPQREFFNTQREKGILSKKKLLLGAADATTQYHICANLANDYRPYQSDSSLLFSGKSLFFANQSKQASHIIDAQITLSLAYTQTGMYAESESLLKKIDLSQLSRQQKGGYYIARVNLNRYRSISSPQSCLLPNYGILRAAYQDSLLMVVDKETPEYAVAKADRHYDEGEYEAVREVMTVSLQKLELSDRAYGYTSYTLASAYGKLGDTDSQIRYLALSAISDIVCAQRENASLRELALLLYKHKDINRAYRYIKVALEDAMFSKAKLRSYEVMQILPLIEHEYVTVRDRMNRNMKIFGWTLSFFVVILLASVWIISRQKLKQHTLLIENEKMNVELKEVNDKLKESNQHILISNAQLEKLSHYQENYIAHYLQLSSSYIGKLDDYRKMLFKKAVNDSKETLIKTLKSKDLIDQEFQQFYKDFDKSFIDLHPDFVENFNKLMKDEEQVVLKGDELLNSELRIFALIRLGITDSAQIAKFLGYSVTTIYNYRTKMRNNAKLPREEFKKAVMKI